MGEKVCFKIDGEWFTNFIRNLYFYENYPLDECKEKIYKSLNLYEDKNKEQIALSIIFGYKKLIGTNAFDLVEDIDFDVYKYSIFDRPKNLIVNKGLNGILTKDGIFVECEYGQHGNTINSVWEKCNNNYNVIMFFNGINNNGCYPYIKIENNKSIYSESFDTIYDCLIAGVNYFNKNIRSYL